MKREHGHDRLIWIRHLFRLAPEEIVVAASRASESWADSIGWVLIGTADSYPATTEMGIWADGGYITERFPFHLNTETAGRPWKINGSSPSDSILRSRAETVARLMAPCCACCTTTAAGAIGN